jgi:hypothetical protein
MTRKPPQSQAHIVIFFQYSLSIFIFFSLYECFTNLSMKGSRRLLASAIPVAFFCIASRAVNEPSLGEPGLSKLAYLKILRARARAELYAELKI